jgi:pimeloyl-ACP methyl ester carboxylesterase
MDSIFAEDKAMMIACSTISAVSCLAIAMAYKARQPIQARTAASLSVPAALIAAATAMAASVRGAPTSIGAVLLRVIAPLISAAAASHMLASGASLAEAEAAEAALFSSALEGSGIQFTTALVAGHHTVAFFRAGVEPLGASVPMASSDLPPLILLAGFGGGAPLWALNVRAIVSNYAGRVFAVDWRGTGCSPRSTPWAAQGPRASEDFFLQGLEDWRRVMGLGADAAAILVGHSLGGALALAAWLRNPRAVAGLVLLSPACLISNGFFDAKGPPRAGAPFAGRPYLRAIVRALATSGWEAGLTPGMLVRALGPCGRGAVRAALSARAKRWARMAQGVAPFDAGALEHLAAWLFHTQAAPGCGEHALRHVFKPGADPRDPLLQRLQSFLNSGCLATPPRRPPVAFAYGDSDWMPVDGGRACVQALHAEGFEEDEATVQVVETAGHHLYLENPAAVNSVILRVCRLVQAKIQTRASISVCL